MDDHACYGNGDDHQTPRTVPKVWIKDTGDGKLVRVRDGTRLRELIHPLRAPVRIGYGVVRATLDPGEASKPHREIGSETYYFLGGRGRLNVDYESYEVTSGLVAWVPPCALQWLECLGKTGLDFICILEPPYSEDGEEVLEHEH
jgi:mannose-6-phosphate isomerase-like protein (cupin superfamily)